MSNIITIKVNLETIESGNADLLLCEARDYLESKSQINYSQAKKKLSEYLIKNNYRETPERYAVLEEICNNPKKPFNAKSIYYSMRDSYKVSIPTVYNAFNLFLDLNLIEVSNKIDQPKLKGVFKNTFFEIQSTYKETLQVS